MYVFMRAVRLLLELQHTLGNTTKRGPKKIKLNWNNFLTVLKIGEREKEKFKL